MSGLTRFTQAPGAPGDTVDGAQRGEATRGTGLDHAQLPAPLRRFLQPRPAPTGPTCELCGVAVAEADHRHVVDLDARGMLCSCRGCALLFLDQGAAGGSYRTVPEDARRVEDFQLDPVSWGMLAIPVGIAFVVDNSRLGETVAFYPSPGGATESELPLAAWGAIVADNPSLAHVEADVEAVLVRTDRPSPGRPDEVPDEPQCWVVPVDRCYELVGLLRLHWRGFDGGSEVRAAIAAFFGELEGVAS